MWHRGLVITYNKKYHIFKNIKYDSRFEFELPVFPVLYEFLAISRFLLLVDTLWKYEMTICLGIA